VNRADTADTFAWLDLALCGGLPPDLFIGPDGEQQHEKPARAAAAKAVCANCLVVRECLDYAITGGIRFGVFGGTGEDERQALQRNYVRRPGAAKGRAA
jgi:WhiB family redox-sensing transcriptional regulator